MGVTAPPVMVVRDRAYDEGDDGRARRSEEEDDVGYDRVLGKKVRGILFQDCDVCVSKYHTVS